jgi:uncharacterized membrane protein (UPF0136 family)
MKPETILWIYIVMLVMGGLIGFLKAKSKISLITSVAFAIVLGICALEKFPTSVNARIEWGLLSFLALFFLLRFLKNKKFMPGGMMTLLTIATIIAMVFIKQ